MDPKKPDDAISEQAFWDELKLVGNHGSPNYSLIRKYLFFYPRRELTKEISEVSNMLFKRLHDELLCDVYENEILLLEFLDFLRFTLNETHVVSATKIISRLTDDGLCIFLRFLIRFLQQSAKWILLGNFWKEFFTRISRIQNECIAQEFIIFLSSISKRVQLPLDILSPIFSLPRAQLFTFLFYKISPTAIVDLLDCKSTRFLNDAFDVIRSTISLQSMDTIRQTYSKILDLPIHTLTPSFISLNFQITRILPDEFQEKQAYFISTFFQSENPLVFKFFDNFHVIKPNPRILSIFSLAALRLDLNLFLYQIVYCIVIHHQTITLENDLFIRLLQKIFYHFASLSHEDIPSTPLPSLDPDQHIENMKSIHKDRENCKKKQKLFSRCASYLINTVNKLLPMVVNCAITEELYHEMTCLFLIPFLDTPRSFLIIFSRLVEISIARIWHYDEIENFGSIIHSLSEIEVKTDFFSSSESELIRIGKKFISAIFSRIGAFPQFSSCLCAVTNIITFILGIFPHAVLVEVSEIHHLLNLIGPTPTKINSDFARFLFYCAQVYPTIGDDRRILEVIANGSSSLPETVFHFLSGKKFNITPEFKRVVIARHFSHLFNIEEDVQPGPTDFQSRCTFVLTSPDQIAFVRASDMFSRLQEMCECSIDHPETREFLVDSIIVAMSIITISANQFQLVQDLLTLFFRIPVDEGATYFSRLLWQFAGDSEPLSNLMIALCANYETIPETYSQMLLSKLADSDSVSDFMNYISLLLTSYRSSSSSIYFEIAWLLRHCISLGLASVNDYALFLENAIEDNGEWTPRSAIVKPFPELSFLDERIFVMIKICHDSLTDNAFDVIIRRFKLGLSLHKAMYYSLIIQGYKAKTTGFYITRCLSAQNPNSFDFLGPLFRTNPQSVDQHSDALLSMLKASMDTPFAVQIALSLKKESVRKFAEKHPVFVDYVRSLACSKCDISCLVLAKVLKMDYSLFEKFYTSIQLAAIMKTTPKVTEIFNPAVKKCTVSLPYEVKYYYRKQLAKMGEVEENSPAFFCMSNKKRAIIAAKKKTPFFTLAIAKGTDQLRSIMKKHTDEIFSRPDLFEILISKCTNDKLRKEIGAEAERRNIALYSQMAGIERLDIVNENEEISPYSPDSSFVPFENEEQIRQAIIRHRQDVRIITLAFESMKSMKSFINEIENMVVEIEENLNEKTINIYAPIFASLVSVFANHKSKESINARAMAKRLSTLASLFLTVVMKSDVFPEKLKDALLALCDVCGRYRHFISLSLSMIVDSVTSLANNGQSSKMKVLMPLLECSFKFVTFVTSHSIPFDTFVALCEWFDSPVWFISFQITIQLLKEYPVEIIDRLILSCNSRLIQCFLPFLHSLNFCEEKFLRPFIEAKYPSEKNEYYLSLMCQYLTASQSDIPDISFRVNPSVNFDDGVLRRFFERARDDEITDIYERTSSSQVSFLPFTKIRQLVSLDLVSRVDANFQFLSNFFSKRQSQVLASVPIIALKDSRNIGPTMTFAAGFNDAFAVPFAFDWHGKLSPALLRDLEGQELEAISNAVSDIVSGMDLETIDRYFKDNLTNCWDDDLVLSCILPLGLDALRRPVPFHWSQTFAEEMAASKKLENRLLLDSAFDLWFYDINHQEELATFIGPMKRLFELQGFEMLKQRRIATETNLTKGDANAILRYEEHEGHVPLLYSRWCIAPQKAPLSMRNARAFAIAIWIEDSRSEYANVVVDLEDGSKLRYKITREMQTGRVGLLFSLISALLKTDHSCRMRRQKISAIPSAPLCNGFWLGMTEMTPVVATSVIERLRSNTMKEEGFQVGITPEHREWSGSLSWKYGAMIAVMTALGVPGLHPLVMWIGWDNGDVTALDLGEKWWQFEDVITSRFIDKVGKNAVTKGIMCAARCMKHYAERIRVYLRAYWGNDSGIENSIEEIEKMENEENVRRLLDAAETQGVPLIMAWL